jgi:surface antigen
VFPTNRIFSALPAALALSGLVALGACQNLQDSPKQSAGTVLGGVGGAVLGAQFGKGSGQLAATAAGTLLGAFVGSEIGKSLDRADRQAMSQATQQAQTAPIGESIAWNNPESGHHGTVTPVRDGRSESSGAYCREYKQTVVIDGRSEEAYGTACQQPDGTWRIVQ